MAIGRGGNSIAPVVPQYHHIDCITSTQKNELYPICWLGCHIFLTHPLRFATLLMHQRAVDHFYKEERTIMRDPIDLKQSERSRSRGRVQIGLAILTVIAIIIASIVVFQPFSSTQPATTIHGTTLTVGGTSDVEGQLLTKLYTLLLRKAGFTVNEKPAVVDSSKLFPA